MWSDPHVDGQSPWILLCRAGKWYDPVWRWPLGTWAPLGRSKIAQRIDTKTDSKSLRIATAAQNRSNAEAEKAKVDSKTSQITTAQNRSDATPVVVSQMEIAQTLCL